MNQALAPRHLQLRDILLRRWKTNGLKTGDRIESQNEIVQLCEFSLITVVKTLKDLETEGVIRREVGKGSFLRKAPWAESWYRIGLLYNRDVVGGGIFRNAFYTEIVMAFERQVVGDGHSFSMTSIANKGTRLSDVDALDVAVLTAISGDTRLDFIDKATTQIALIDHVIDHPKVHCYRVDYTQAMVAMTRHLADAPRRFLYLDTVLGSSERPIRLSGAQSAVAGGNPGNVLDTIAVDPETGGTEGLETLLAHLSRYPADVVFGHVPHDWREAVIGTGAQVYPFTVATGMPGLWLDAAAWMAEVLPRIYANFEDRRAPGLVHEFPAVFRP